jgi:hypothetical protein
MELGAFGANEKLHRIGRRADEKLVTSISPIWKGAGRE